MALGVLLSLEDLMIVGFTVGMALFGIASLICAIVSYRREREKVVNSSEEGIDLSGELHHSEGYEDLYFPLGRGLLRSRLGMAKTATALVFFLFMLVVLLLCVVFNHLPSAAGIVLMLVVSWTILLYCVPYQRKQHEAWWKDLLFIIKTKLMWSPRIVIPSLLIILIVDIALNIGLEGACLENLSLLSTRLSRSYEQPTCVAGRPCYVYLTLSRPKKGAIPPTLVLYDTVSHAAGGDYAFNATGNVYTMTDLEVHRDVHWTHLTNLLPSTTYYCVAGPGYDEYGNAIWSEEFKFRTGPHDDSPYIFMVGGDMGNLTAVGELTTIAADQEPLFAVVGGDIAYEYAQTTCYRRVDTWLGNWMSTMRTRDGFYIPLLTAIGNHEVYADFFAKPEQVPFYIKYFPHMDADVDPGNYGKEMYYSSEATSSIKYSPFDVVNYISLEWVPSSNILRNNTLLLVLDSGHVAHPAGTQAEWLTNQLSSIEGRTRSHKFTTYHVPMYPTNRAYTTANSVRVRDAWTKIFDEYGVDVSFENHDHAYKRTLYVGDGCWGITARQLPSDSPRWYHAVASSTQYVLRVNVTSDDVMFAALDTHGAIFDDFELNQQPQRLAHSTHKVDEL